LTLRKPYFLLVNAIMQQKAENDYETMYNELKKQDDHTRKLSTGCETYENAQFDYDAHETKPYVHYINQVESIDIKRGAYLGNDTVESCAWRILTGSLKLRLPILIYNDDLQKYRFFEKVRSLVAKIKTYGDFDCIAPMFEKYGCPSCGTKDLQHLECDGESEADGCSADWAIWEHWSIFCNNKPECEGWGFQGSNVTQSGGNY